MRLPRTRPVRPLTRDLRRLLRRRRLPTPRRESADKGAKKAAEARETTKEVAAEGAEKAAATCQTRMGQV